METKPTPWNVVPHGSKSALYDQNDELVARGMELADAEFIAELVKQEWKFQSSLVMEVPNAYPYVVEVLERDGELARYHVARKGVGGSYSDELGSRSAAAHVAATLEREEATKEQLRYRIWQLERSLKEVTDTLDDCLLVHIYETIPDDAPEPAMIDRAYNLLGGKF